MPEGMASQENHPKSTGGVCRCRPWGITAQEPAALEQQRGKKPPNQKPNKNQPTNLLQRLWKTPLLAAWCKVTELQGAGL